MFEAIVTVIVVVVGIIAFVANMPSNKKKKDQAGESDGYEEKTPYTQPVATKPQDGEKLSNNNVPAYSTNLPRRPVDKKKPGEAAYAAGHHESHCDVDSHSNNDKYRVEKVPVMNSIGGKSSEGCSEHYDVRFVKIDEEEKDTSVKLNDLQKAIVYGEILNNPAFKRGGRINIR